MRRKTTYLTVSILAFFGLLLLSKPLFKQVGNGLKTDADPKGLNMVEEVKARKEARNARYGGSKREAKIHGRQEFINGITIPFGMDRSPAPAGYIGEEYKKVRAASRFAKAAGNPIQWIQRGPNNVSGRTRGLIVDPDDPTFLTWYAGTASGGVWKTTDGGDSWRCLSDDLPYQSTTTLAMAGSNHNVIYMGTGESFWGAGSPTGGGIFRSTDRGETWTHLGSTMLNEDFRYVNRIEVDPGNDSIILAATTAGIFKSVDAGETFIKTYADQNIEDLVADTSDFNYIFASINSQGIIRSSDGGDTWEAINDGLGIRSRIELAISPSDPQRIYASVETSATGALYASWNRGDSWELVVDDANEEYNFHGGQGGYDNTIAVHPYNSSIVYFGGVDLWKAQVSASTTPGEGVFVGYDTINTSSFLGFTNFTGEVMPGMSTGDLEGATDLVDSDWASVEIRFGPGMSQKAHRFFVPEEATSGVLASSYTYVDYVDVPFEVWDVTNNRQLMCSFRDQERDGKFNLYERTGDNYGEMGREYLFINAVAYNASTPNPNIATTGGRSYKMLYFFWPTLAEDGVWNENNLPESRIDVNYAYLTIRDGAVTPVVDVYGRWGGSNEWNYTDEVTEGSHPDHHEIVTIPVNPATNDFWILNSNDGGMAISKDKGVTFTQLDRSLHTTQFYGVAKKAFRNEFIGGMQDNGTWKSPQNEEATSESYYEMKIGGDGFEAVWHQQDTTRIMATLYNTIYRSLSNGAVWTTGMWGLDDQLPFYVKLTPVPSNNNIIFTVGTDGIFKTDDFGVSEWEKKNVGSPWLGPYAEVTSSHEVAVSKANEDIVWAGAGLYEEVNLKMFISKNQGSTYIAATEPSTPVPALISGLELHPVDENTAYLLYSLYGYPKILRTTDLGVTWEDITQVNASGVSENGFPNVGVHSLVVFPDSTNVIWAGTEIGIMESRDNGESWHYLESNLPTVPIYQLTLQDNVAIAATYGRGIWTCQYGPVLNWDDLNTELGLSSQITLSPNPTSGNLTIDLGENQPGTVAVQVYNLNGKLVISKKLTHNSGEKIKLDLTGQKQGMYIVTLEYGDQVVSKRIILE
ncbi:MAG: T9SS type A sorting domain-containing protein [Bacteroidales bacterium]|nr:T9SS type A sorting domain-containing protein [Bacteroidales bacterium]